MNENIKEKIKELEEAIERYKRMYGIIIED